MVSSKSRRRADQCAGAVGALWLCQISVLVRPNWTIETLAFFPRNGANTPHRIPIQIFRRPWFPGCPPFGGSAGRTRNRGFNKGLSNSSKARRFPVAIRNILQGQTSSSQLKQLTPFGDCRCCRIPNSQEATAEGSETLESCVAQFPPVLFARGPSSGGMFTSGQTGAD